MRAVLEVPRSEPTEIAAANCRRWQHLADPLWFRFMCIDLWGDNAAKELHAILDKSDRTCRAWASGESEPPARVLAMLIVSNHGFRVITWIVRGFVLTWWANVQRAIRITEDVDKLDLG